MGPSLASPFRDLAKFKPKINQKIIQNTIFVGLVLAAVLEAAVVSARDDADLEKPKAYIVLKEGAASLELAEELKAFVKEKIGKWKYPRWIEFAEDLPKTATGKIQRFKLREDT